MKRWLVSPASCQSEDCENVTPETVKKETRQEIPVGNRLQMPAATAKAALAWFKEQDKTGL
eukprot:5646318-Prymnesium_polylepis.1